MTQKPRLRFVIHRSSLFTKCIVIAMLIATTVASLTLVIGIRKGKALYQFLTNWAVTLEQEQAELEEDIPKADSVEGQKEIANEELGLVDPNTVIITPEN